MCVCVCVCVCVWLMVFAARGSELVEVASRGWREPCGTVFTAGSRHRRALQYLLPPHERTARCQKLSVAIRHAGLRLALAQRGWRPAQHSHTPSRVRAADNKGDRLARPQTSDPGVTSPAQPVRNQTQCEIPLRESQLLVCAPSLPSHAALETNGRPSIPLSLIFCWRQGRRLARGFTKGVGKILRARKEADRPLCCGVAVFLLPR